MRTQDVRRPQHRDQGASTVEYGLMVAAIAAVVTAAVFSLGSMVNASFEQTQNCIATQQSAPNCSAGPLEGSLEGR